MRSIARAPTAPETHSGLPDAPPQNPVLSNAELHHASLPGTPAGHPTSDELAVAEITAPHGVRGLVRCLPLTDFPEDLGRLDEVIVTGGRLGGRRQVMSLLGAQPHGRVLLFQLAGVDTPEAAEGLRGALVKIPRSAAHPLPPGHYYISDIVGIEVFTEEGRPLGTIREVRRTGSNDVYHTERALIPATREAVLELDVPRRRMVVLAALVVEG